MKNPLAALDLGPEGWAIIIIWTALVLILFFALIAWLTFP